jgi:hypothetical protein
MVGRRQAYHLALIGIAPCMIAGRRFPAFRQETLMDSNYELTVYHTDGRTFDLGFAYIELALSYARSRLSEDNVNGVEIRDNVRHLTLDVS